MSPGQGRQERRSPGSSDVLKVPAGHSGGGQGKRRDARLTVTVPLQPAAIVPPRTEAGVIATVGAAGASGAAVTAVLASRTETVAGGRGLGQVHTAS